VSSLEGKPDDGLFHETEEVRVGVRVMGKG